MPEPATASSATGTSAITRGGDRNTAGQRPPRILAFFYNDPDEYPPIINATRLLAARGFEIELFCRATWKNWEVPYPEAVRVERIRTGPGGTGVQFARFLRIALSRMERRCDLVVGHDMHGFVAARVAATYLRRPLVYHCHDFTGQERVLAMGGQTVRSFQQIFARTADMTIMPDVERAELVQGALRLPRAPFVVANAPLHSPRGAEDRLSAALRARGLHFDRVILRQGRIGPTYGIEETLQSMRLWKGDRWGFVIMGSVAHDFDRTLMALAASLGLQQRFAILPAVEYDAVGHFTIGADLGHALYEPSHINQRYYATAANKIMEYMAAGVPVLMSKTSGTQALLARHRCGVIADEKWPPSIAEAVNRVLLDETARRAMGCAGSTAFEAEYRMALQYEPVLRAFNRLMRARRR